MSHEQIPGSGVVYRAMRAGDVIAASALVADSFARFVGHAYPPEGVREFMAFAAADAMAARLADGAIALVAEQSGELVGYVELRGADHVAMLFVAPQRLRQGIGSGLFDAAMEQARIRKPDLARVTVNSSTYAVTVYERLGFRATGPEQTVNGMTFVPMACSVVGRRRSRTGTSSGGQA